LRKTHDLAVKVGNYQDKEGKTKNRYKNVGYVLTADDGGKMRFIDRTFNPAGCPFNKPDDDSVLVYEFEIKSNNTPAPGAPADNGPPASVDSGPPAYPDDIPY